MAAIAWTYDCQVLREGPATGSSASLPYHDKAYRLAVESDSEPDVLIAFAEDTLGPLGISRQALAVYAQLERANTGKYISQAPIGQLLSLLFRFRVPGTDDKGNGLYRSAIEAWPTYADLELEDGEDDHSEAWYTAPRPKPKGLTFGDDQMPKIISFLRAWRSAVGLNTASGFKFIMTVNKPDEARDKYKLATHMLLYGLSYTLDLNPVTIQAKGCVNVLSVLNALQKTVMQNKYPALYGPPPPNDAADSGSFATLAATRHKLVEAYCRLKSNPELGLSDLCADCESKVAATGTADVRLVKDLYRPSWPA